MSEYSDEQRDALLAVADKLILLGADPYDLLTADPNDHRMVINVALWLKDEANGLHAERSQR